jgi:putative ABC transport system permease protein
MLRRSRLEGRMDAEIRFHLESYRDDLMRQGVPRHEAMRRARLEFGGIGTSKEQCREARGLRWPSEVSQDVRYGLRSLRKSPGFTAVALLTLALGIGANTAIFSVLRAVVLRPLPYPDPARLVIIREQDTHGNSFSVTWPDFVDWRGQSRSFAAMAAYSPARLLLTGVERPALLNAAHVSASYFPLLGVKAELGRTFVSAEDSAGAGFVTVLSDALWRSAFGADPGIVGRTVVLSGSAYAVIGVVEPYLSRGGPVDAYLPVGLRAGDPSFNNRGAHGSMHVLARLVPGTSFGGARASLDTVMARLEKQFPASNAGHRTYMVPLTDSMTGELRRVFYVLLAAVSLVLLIACVNVANLLLARAADRQKEIAVRASLGASRGRIARQMMVESLLLAMAGGVAGVACGAALLGPLIHFAPQQIPRLDTVRIDPGVLAFSLAISLATGVLFGLAPALQVMRTDGNGALKEGSRNSTGSRSRSRLRAGLIVTEVMFATVLLTASMLLLRSLGAALAVDPGFRAGHLAALDVTLLGAKYEPAAAGHQFLAEASRELAAIPGVEAVGAAACPPLQKDCGDYWYEVPGRTHFTPGNADDSLFNIVGSGYFAAIGATVLQGREFNSSDITGAPPVAIINETLARKWWPRDSPVGWQVKFGGPGEKGPLYEIVGVVRDVNREGLDAPPEPEIFLAAAQARVGRLAFLVRSSLSPLEVVSLARRVLHRLDKDLAVRSAVVTQTMSQSLAERKFTTALLAAFGALALTLAGVGIFGVIAYQAAQQTHEIGIRKALGARTSDIVGMYSRRAAVLVMSGTLLGVLCSLASSRLLATMLFGVKPWDWLTLAAAVSILTALGLAAGYIPARRAGRLDAMAALRQE